MDSMIQALPLYVGSLGAAIITVAWFITSLLMPFFVYGIWKRSVNVDFATRDLLKETQEMVKLLRENLEVE